MFILPSPLFAKKASCIIGSEAREGQAAQIPGGKAAQLLRRRGVLFRASEMSGFFRSPKSRDRSIRAFLGCYVWHVAGCKGWPLKLNVGPRIRCLRGKSFLSRKHRTYGRISKRKPFGVYLDTP